jgi:hypothetical protein
MKTKVKVRCISKKESENFDPKNPVTTNIELKVPYDQNSIYYQLSGGTGFNLNTINKEAAGMFIIGKDYDVIIAPSEE